jgi:hypothetical protein
MTHPLLNAALSPSIFTDALTPYNGPTVGYGEGSKPRSRRLSVEQACLFL